MDRRISERVVETVANHTHTDPLELPPLYDALDPDALDAFTDELADGEVSFRYAGHVVTVDSNRTIDVADGPRASDSPASVAGEAIDRP